MNSLGARSNTRRGRRGPGALGPRRQRRPAALGDQAGRLGALRRDRRATSWTPTSCRSRSRRAPSRARAASCPATRSTSEIARLRHSTPGVGLISPPPHHDIYSIEDLAQLIHDLKARQPGGRDPVKLVAEAGVGTVAAGVAKAQGRAHRDRRATTAARAPRRCRRVEHAGLPWELGIAETQQVLVVNGAARARAPAGRRRAAHRPRRASSARCSAPRSSAFSTAPLDRRGLRDDARLPPQHVPGRHRHAGSRAAPPLHGHAGARRHATSCSSPRRCAS